MNHLKSREFGLIYEKFYSELLNYIIQIKSPALVLRSDTTFFKKTLKDIYKKIKKPSFIYLHGGLHASYKPYRFNLSDYLVVWGDIHKELYIKNGFSENKILVTGNYHYQIVAKKITI